MLLLTSGSLKILCIMIILAGLSFSSLTLRDDFVQFAPLADRHFPDTIHKVIDQRLDLFHERVSLFLIAIENAHRNQGRWGEDQAYSKILR